MIASSGEPPAPPPAGRIETPPPGTAVHRGQVVVGGWALGEQGPMTELLVVVDGRRATAARLAPEHLPRDDVAERYPAIPDARRAAWDAIIDVRWVGSRSTTLSLLGRTRAGDWVELAKNEIRIDDPISPSRGGRAAFTIVQNEPVFLPLWLRYYGRHFDSADIYVLDHDSTDGSTALAEGVANVVRVHREVSFDHTWLTGVVEDFQAFLLRSYHAVLFAEADEFIVPDPECYAGIGDYMERLKGLTARCSGYNVVHYPDDEAPLSFDQPILGQRRYWHPSPQWYSKRLLSKVPLSWNIGFHQEFNAPDVSPDPELFLVHLHRVDYEYCLDRHRAVTAREWYEGDRQFDLGWHYRVVEPDEFREWFFHGDDLEGSGPEPIPERLKEAL
jgi:Glycosyl transferase family 2